MRAFKMWSWTLGKKCRIVRFRWGKRRGVWSPCSKYQLQLQASEDHSWGYIGGSCSQEKKSWIWFELGNSVVIWGWEQSSHHSQHHLVLLRPIIELCLLAHLKHIWVPLKPPPPCLSTHYTSRILTPMLRQSSPSPGNQLSWGGDSNQVATLTSSLVHIQTPPPPHPDALAKSKCYAGRNFSWIQAFPLFSL